MNEIIAYTLFALFVLAQFAFGIGFFIWMISIGLPWFLSWVPLIFVFNAVCGIVAEINTPIK